MNKELAKLLARLTALKNNLPKHLVLRKYADEFNSVLAELEKNSNENLNEFKILTSEIQPRVTSFNMISSSKTYSSETYCDREFLLMKIDGVLGYFTLLLQPIEIKNQMGFSVEENE
jgi:hypothetical protein